MARAFPLRPRQVKCVTRIHNMHIYLQCLINSHHPALPSPLVIIPHTHSI